MIISKFKCPYISKEEIWKAAENFRKEYWQEATLPVDIEQIVDDVWDELLTGASHNIQSSAGNDHIAGSTVGL